jgi:hypothetical protein
MRTSAVSWCSPEIVAAEAVHDAAIELVGVRAVVEAGPGADAVALAAGPLADVGPFGMESLAPASTDTQ